MPREDLIQYRRSTADEWANSVQGLADGEVGYDITNNQIRVGDGYTKWEDLKPLEGDSAHAAAALELAQQADETATSTADVVNNGRLAEDQLSATFAEVRLFEVKAFLNPGETLPNNGTLDAQPLLDRACAAAAAHYNATGEHTQVHVPKGRWALPVATLAARSGVGILGDGPVETIFMPKAKVSFLSAPTYTSTPPEGGYPFIENFRYENFTVDAIGQTDTVLNATIKAFYGHNWRNGKLISVVCRDTWNTMYGLDFCVNVEFVNCTAIRAGRSRTEPVYNSNGAGFGIGVGRFADESARFVGCEAIDCKGPGFFFELLEERGAVYQTQRILIQGGRVNGCGSGLADCGAGGIEAYGTDFSRNVFHGWWVGAGGQSSVGGRDGVIDGCTLSFNGQHGVHIWGPNTAGGYKIRRNRIEGNIQYGILGGSSVSLSRGGLQVCDNEFLWNGYRGLFFTEWAGVAYDILIDNNVFDGNGATHATNREGLYFDVSAHRPIITRNRFRDTKRTARQTVGLRVNSDRYLLLPTVTDNDFTGQPTATQGVTAVEQTMVARNTVTRYPTYEETLISAATVAFGTSGGWAQAADAGVGSSTVSNGWRSNTGSGIALHYRTAPGSAGYGVATEFRTSSTRSMRGLAHSVDVSGGVSTAVILEVGTAALSLVKRIAGVRTVVWSSGNAPINGQRIELARYAGSTLTDVYVNGVLAQSIDIPDVPFTRACGVAGNAGGSDKLAGFRIYETAPAAV